ncbi:DUF481 domain-containing protein [Aequorivita marina]|uniref:DUF481 domain-containing protein n=1 Tax=Aequorivita marina TaxID=3073654 RepID=UPI002873FA94|nr:DUF481 domain-containing protein [Aequorivita sp. S2608]MDS1297111.1 DUF481 domain-containing protein [Aequorivita sp. S2608]
MNLKHILSCLGLLLSLVTYAQKDTLVLRNGDKLIGDIEKLDRGVLNFSTSYSSGDLKVKWKKVQSVSSKQGFLVTGAGGTRYKITGLHASVTNDSLILRDGAGIFNTNDVVFINRLKKDSFVSRLNASLSFGFNFAKSSKLSQLTAAASLGYTSDFYSIRTKFNATRTNQDEVEEIQRTAGQFSFNYFLKRDYFLMLQSEYLSNSEQNLKLRMTNKLGLGKYFIRNNSMFFGGNIGLAWNNEAYDDSVDKNRNSGEAFVALGVNFFDFNSFSLVSEVTAYPSLTEKERLRADFNLDLKYDLPLDLFLKLGFNYNYDSKPAEGTAYDDYIIRTTLGWEL